MDPSWSEWAVTGLLLATVLLAGLVGGLTPGDNHSRVDSGNATLRVVQPADAPLEVTAGRFGTAVAYLRLPDLVVDVRSVTGSPELVYTVTVPELGVEERTRYVLASDSPGRLRIEVDHRGLHRSALEAERYTGRVVVRLQSFSTEQILIDRSVTILVQR